MPGLEEEPRGGRSARFSPQGRRRLQGLACELPARAGRPFSRWSVSDLASEAQRAGLVATISGSTIWRWLDATRSAPGAPQLDFPRDPDFAIKAGRILDLYERVWEGQPLNADDFVISADEKTSIQARRRCHATTPPESHQPMRVEHEYERGGRGPISRRWMCTGPSSSAAASARRASSPSGASSGRS